MTAQSKTGLILWGASGHGRVIADIVRLQGEYELAGFIDDADPAVLGPSFCGLPVLGGATALAILPAKNMRHIIVAIGNCRTRLACADKAASHGFRFATAIHPKSCVAQDVEIGPGTVIMAGAVVNPGTSLGPHAIINTSASVDHDCRLEQGAHVSPGARLAGGVSVGTASWIGMGALIKQNVRIGRDCVVGAGSLVLEDVPDGTTVWGTPASVKRRTT